MPTRAGSANFLHSYNLFASAATLAVAAYAILAEKLPWRRMLLITLAILVFPCISGNYKELLLFIPLAAFLDAPEGTSRDKLVCAVIGFLMIPKNYVMLYGDVSIAVVLDPLACLLLLYVTIRDRFLARPTVSEPREAGAAGT
jgi:hypothetical protein